MAGSGAARRKNLSPRTRANLLAISEKARAVVRAAILLSLSARREPRSRAACTRVNLPSLAWTWCEANESKRRENFTEPRTQTSSEEYILLGRSLSSRRIAQSRDLRCLGTRPAVQPRRGGRAQRSYHHVAQPPRLG